MWGTDRWGEMVWGGVAVPTLPFAMLSLLMFCCFIAGGYFLRPGHRGPKGYLAAALLVMAPLSVAALTLPYTFVNGTIADAAKVNANFAALASATEVQNCPSGMTRIDRLHSILCYATGPINSWDQASAYCSNQFRARICNIQQWRDAVCSAGLPNPGASWTDAITGSGSLGVVSGWTGDSISSSPYTSQRATSCCLEWPRY